MTYETHTIPGLPQNDFVILDAYKYRDVTTGATGATEVAPKLSDKDWLP